MKKEIMVIKDTKLLGLQNVLEIQWSKRLVDENDKILDKENVRGTIDLDMAQVQGSDASDRLLKFMPELNLAILKENGELQAQINAISKECAVKVKSSKDADKERLLIRDENLKLIEACKTFEANMRVAESINNEMYEENKNLKAGREKLLADMVKLDENIINLNSQINSKNEKDKSDESKLEYLAKENETLNIQIAKINSQISNVNTENKLLISENEELKKQKDSNLKTILNLGQNNRDLSESIIQLNKKLTEKDKV